MSEGKATFDSVQPALWIGDYDKAVAHYVDWLGFNLDWEWRSSPGGPAIISVSRDGVSLFLAEHPNNVRNVALHMRVSNHPALIEELNGRRPGSFKPNYRVTDPFGNTLVFDPPPTPKDDRALEAAKEKMRAHVKKLRDADKPFPTWHELGAIAGGTDEGAQPMIAAAEILMDSPGFAEDYQAERTKLYESVQLQVVELSPRPVLVIERPVKLSGLPALTGKLIAQVQAHLAAEGLQAAGDPILQVLTADGNQVTIACGVPVEASVSGSGEIELRELCGGKAVSATFDGVDRGQEVWRYVFEYAYWLGYDLGTGWVASQGWQAFVVDPAEPTKIQSKLYLPLPKRMRAGG